MEKKLKRLLQDLREMETHLTENLPQIESEANLDLNKKVSSPKLKESWNWHSKERVRNEKTSGKLNPLIHKNKSNFSNFYKHESF